MKRRYTAALLALAIALALLPVSGADGTDSGKLEALTQNHDGTLSTFENNQITITPETLQWTGADAAAHRNNDGWWVGMNIVSPPMTEDEAAAVRYSAGAGGPWSAVPWDSTRGDAPRKERIMQLWGEVNPLFISRSFVNSQSGAVEYKRYFKWNKADPPVEYTLRIDPSHLKLIKGGVECYPSNCAMEADNAEKTTSSTKLGQANADLTVKPVSVPSTATEIKVKAIAPAMLMRNGFPMALTAGL